MHRSLHRSQAKSNDKLLHFLSHSILVGFLHRTQFALKIDTDFEVQISNIPGVWLHLEHSCHLLAFLACQVLIQVEDSLLPMSIWGLWSGGESNPLMTLGKLDVEKSNKRLTIVISLQLDMKWTGERNIFLGACLNVYFLDETGVRDHLIPAHTSGVLKVSC